MKSSIWSQWCFTLCCPLITLTVAFESAWEAESALLDDLFQYYNPLIRPVYSYDNPVDVTLSLLITQILDVDEKNQLIAVECWLTQQWRDVNLQWNPKKYRDVHQVHLPHEWIWKPDIVMFQNADGNFTGQFNTKATLKSSGEVEWSCPMIFRSSCQIDVTYFPYDTQNCSLTFGSWTYDRKEVDLKLGDVAPSTVLSKFMENGEWDFHHVEGLKHNSLFDKRAEEIEIRQRQWVRTSDYSCTQNGQCQPGQQDCPICGQGSVCCARSSLIDGPKCAAAAAEIEKERKFQNFKTRRLDSYCTKPVNSGHSNWTIIRSDFNCAEECPSGGPCEVGCGQPGTPKLGALCCSGHRGQHAACTDDVADAINIRHESDQFRCIKPIQQDLDHEEAQFDVFDHPDVQFRMIMRRYPLFYNAFLITPCLLISFLTALVYYLPCASHQKITFCTSVLLAHTFYLMVIAEIIPSTGDTIPLIAEYLLLNMIFITLSIVITTLVLNIHYRSPSSHPPLPAWMRHLFLRILPRVLFVSPPKDELGVLLAKHECQLTLHLLINGLPESNRIVLDQAKKLVEEKRLPEDFLSTADDLDNIAQKYKDEIRNQTEVSEWRFVAILMDRIFLYLFLLVSLFGIVVLFLPAWVDYSSKGS